MCGIVGVFGNAITVKDLTIFKQMLTVDSFRGMHATGMFSVMRNGECSVVKKNVPGWDFVDMKSVDDHIKVAARALIGHNRHATQGGRTSENAHPFQFGNITGVHNGTLHGTTKLDSDHDVDSAQLYEHMAAHGYRDALEKAEGHMALVWHDSDDNTLNIIRNPKRPLAICAGRKKDIVYIASEAEMLRWILTRNDVDVDKEDEWLFIDDMETLTLYKWQLGENLVNPTFRKKKILSMNTNYDRTYGVYGGFQGKKYQGNQLPKTTDLWDTSKYKREDWVALEVVGKKSCNSYEAAGVAKRYDLEFEIVDAKDTKIAKCNYVAPNFEVNIGDVIYGQLLYVIPARVGSNDDRIQAYGVANMTLTNIPPKELIEQEIQEGLADTEQCCICNGYTSSPVEVSWGIICHDCVDNYNINKEEL